MWICAFASLPAGFGAETELAATRSFSDEQIEFFETHVRPLLVQHCYECHSTDAEEVQADLYVDSREGMVERTTFGPVVIPGKPDESLLISAVRYESSEMPPDKKLSDQQIAALEKWVAIGAPWPEVTSSPAPTSAATEIDFSEARRLHWAWQVPTKSDVPKRPAKGNAADESMDASPIDRFISAKLHAAGLQPNRLASPVTLIRRIYIDLLGVLPSPAEVEVFVAEARQDRQRAVGQLVDRLLESPLYGQRWARHWLDVARYSDGHGGFLDNKALPDAWRYRDWVVDALNRDIPIDQFLRLQIAGDIVGDYQDAVATGFFALGPEYISDGGDPDSVAQAKGETLDDRIDTLTRGLLGITGSCARCHDHKFDPIQQLDYYALAGVFNNTATRQTPLAEPDAVHRFDEFQKRTKQLQDQINKLQQQLKKENIEPNAEQLTQLQTWQAELDQQRAHPVPAYSTAHTLTESGDQDMHVAVRGNLRRTGPLAPRQFLRILCESLPPRFDSGSGRRNLADAMVDSNNPLTARVFVNRIWMHHFGHGIVRTPNNFGTLGAAPSHPELLDWLAVDFMENGWSLKRLHRQLLTSVAYQRSSDHSPASADLDAGNTLLWRFTSRRIDVEAWRDAMLTVTGELDTTLGGPPEDDIASSRRRTLYARVSRNGDVFASDRFLRRFDFPLMRATVAQRPRSIVPQQFLFLLNSSFMVERATALTQRIDRLAGEDAKDLIKIECIYRCLFSRTPTEQELTVGQQFLSQDATSDNLGLTPWVQYAQVLLSSNEFMFVR
ncbi:MAG: PSD1 domain-containing protein [Planctomycetales bacterium]|nr:PSD1 domain-containing protein [Planctomycetales bacterium]